MSYLSIILTVRFVFVSYLFCLLFVFVCCAVSVISHMDVDSVC
jgi:hypothetical protein